MCLTKITATYDQPSGLIVDGWKIFDGSGKQLRSQHYGQAYVALDTWIQASGAAAPDGIRAWDGRPYKAGFHAYADESWLDKGLFRRVYLRQVTCVGDQDGKKAVVAQEMYVPSDPSAWPSPSSKKLRARRQGGAS